MTLITLIAVNTILAGSIVGALVAFLAHAVHADRRLRVMRSAEIRSLPERRRQRVAA